MTGGGIKIGRWFGIDVSVDGSWMVIAALVAWSFYGLFRIEFPEMAGGVAVLLGVGTAALFFASVVLHEVSHSLMARSRGVPVEGITLFIFGGVTKTKQEADSAGDEFAIAVVGPVTSLALAVIFWALVNLSGSLLPDAVKLGLGHLGWLNLGLGVFNLLPGFPLDGGRVLRSILWKTSGNLGLATKRASAVGQGMGAVMIGLGLMVVFGGNLAGLWYAAIGWFLFQAAGASGQQMAVRQALRDVTAGDLMSLNPRTIPADASLREAVDDYFLRYDHSAFPVADDSGHVLGILSLRAVRQIESDHWEVRQAWSAMTRLADAHTVEAARPMDAVLNELSEPGHERVLVMDGDEVVGIITPSDIARWIRVSQELGIVDRG